MLPNEIKRSGLFVFNYHSCMTLLIAAMITGAIRRTNRQIRRFQGKFFFQAAAARQKR